MSIDAVVRDSDGRQVRGLIDASGGSFDAAGEFDRLLDAVPDARIWSSLDEYGQTTLRAAEAGALLAELPLVTALAHDGPERRGLMRLAVLAAMCASDETLALTFSGD